MSTEQTVGRKACARCGGPAFYWPEAIVPGDPLAPRRSRRAAAHSQPAYACVTCGHLEPEERRVKRSGQRQHA